MASGTLSSWAVLDLEYNAQQYVPYKPKEVEKSAGFQLPTAKSITLAEYSPASQGAITAHRLRDYRKRSFSLVLLPNISVAMDAFFAPITEVSLL